MAKHHRHQKRSPDALTGQGQRVAHVGNPAAIPAGPAITSLAASTPLRGASLVTRERAADGWSQANWLPNPDPVLKALGIDIATYRDMRADAFIGGCIRRRKAAVKGLEQQLERGPAPARVARAIDGILADLYATPDPDEAGAQAGLPSLVAEALDGALYGYQPLEITWGKVGNLLVPQVVQAKPAEWFHFDSDNRLRFRARDTGMDGELLPPRKFLLARQDPTYLNPYGLADLSLAYWPWTFRRAARFWVAWLERYGGDFLIGKLPRANPIEEFHSLTRDLEDMIQSSVAAIPDDGSIEVIASANKGGSSDAHERFLFYWRGEIAVALLGTNQSTEQTSTLASATAALEVAAAIRDSDARMIEAVVNQLIRWTCQVNWPGTPAPCWQLLEQEEIDTTRPQRDKILVEAGVKFSRAYWLRTYDLEEADLAEDLPAALPAPAPALPAPERGAGAATAAADNETDEHDADPAGADAADPPALASFDNFLRHAFPKLLHSLRASPGAPDGQDLIDAEAERDASAAQQAAMDRLLAPILAALADGLTPEEIMARLDDWYGQLDDSLLQELLTRGLAAADALGRLEVAGEGAA